MSIYNEVRELVSLRAEVTRLTAQVETLRAFCEKVRDMSTGGDPRKSFEHRWKEMLDNDVELMKEANALCCDGDLRRASQALTEQGATSLQSPAT